MTFADVSQLQVISPAPPPPNNWYKWPFVTWCIQFINWIPLFLNMFCHPTVGNYKNLSKVHLSFAGTRAKVLIILAWSLAAVFSLPMTFINTEKIMPDGTTQCHMYLPEPWHWKVGQLLFISLSLYSTGYWVYVGHQTQMKILHLEPSTTYILLTCVGVLRWVTQFFLHF